MCRKIKYKQLSLTAIDQCASKDEFSICDCHKCSIQGRGVHVTGVSAAYTFKLNKNILSDVIQLSLY
jgi:hypothetical protein